MTNASPSRWNTGRVGSQARPIFHLLALGVGVGVTQILGLALGVTQILGLALAPQGILDTKVICGPHIIYSAYEHEYGINVFLRLFLVLFVSFFYDVKVSYNH